MKPTRLRLRPPSSALPLPPSPYTNRWPDFKAFSREFTTHVGPLAAWLARVIMTEGMNCVASSLFLSRLGDYMCW